MPHRKTVDRLPRRCRHDGSGGRVRRDRIRECLDLIAGGILSQRPHWTNRKVIVALASVLLCGSSGWRVCDDPVRIGLAALRGGCEPACRFLWCGARRLSATCWPLIGIVSDRASCSKDYPRPRLFTETGPISDQVWTRQIVFVAQNTLSIPLASGSARRGVTVALMRIQRARADTCAGI